MKPDHERIWLQPGAGDCGETTWCQDRILDADIEYIRADIHARALLEAHQRGRLEGMEEAAAHLIRLGKGTPLGHENASLGRSTYNWMSHCATAIRAKAQEAAKEGE